MPNVNSLHRRLDRLGANHGASFAEAMEHATERTRPDRPWTAAGHPGVPPNKPIPPLSPDASHRCRGVWRMVAEGRARAIHGTPEASPFASLASIYILSDGGAG